MRRLSWSLLSIMLAAGWSGAQSIVVETIPAETVTDWTQASFWETIDGQPAELNWEFADGEVRLARPRGGSGSLLSGPLPSNFELTWQWKISKKTNTGLKYRVRKFGSKWLGVEYQIIDDSPSAIGKGSTASIYDLVAPSVKKPLKPLGQWNESRVVAIGNRLQHYLNGTLVTQAHAAGSVWDADYAVSKFWGAEGFGQPGSDDRIMLTDHGGKAVYRKFRFVAHEPSQEDLATSKSAGPFLGNAIRNSWADQSSIVIWTRTTKQAEMNVNGPDFIDISKDEQRQYADIRDEQKLISVQFPEGASTLDEMLGAMPGAAGQVRLTYFPVLQRKQSKSTKWITTSAANDFTAQWKLKNLKPGRQYAAVVEARAVEGEQSTAVVRGGFKTAPAVGKPTDLTFCMTTCHDFIRRDDGFRGHKIYPAMTRIAPDFVVHAGDIEYYDKPRPWAWTKQLMRFKWGRIFGLPSNRDFYAQTTSYFLKDDHDTLKNDCWAGQKYGAVTFTEGVQIFNEEQFPSHTPRYKTTRWGRDVQVWFLEGRDYRSPNTMPDGPEKTILGSEQKTWLFSTLAESDATFKFIFSPTPVVGPDRANKKDNHANTPFAHEGQQMRRELAKHDGVIVFCGDRHWQYASVDDETGLWEFGCGPGSEEHQFGWKKGDVRPVHRFLRVDGGFLSGEVSYDEDKEVPKLMLKHRDVNGEIVSEFAFPESREAS